MLSAFTLAERLLAPATVWVIFAPSRATKIALSFALAVAFMVRSLLHGTFTARTEAELFDRVIASIVGGDVLQPSVLPFEDARVELGQGIHASAQQLSHDLPRLVADLVGCLVLTAVVTAVEPGHLVFVAAVITIVAAATLAWSRHQVLGAVARGWEVQRHLFDKLADAHEGRLEIVAAGRAGPFIAESGELAAAWAKASTRIAAATVLSGRLPLLAIATAVVLAVAADATLRGRLGLTVADLAFFASVTPPFAGVAQGMHALVRGERWVRVVTDVVDKARPMSHERHSPTDGVKPIVFDRVSFRYADAPDATDVLRELTFTWDGERVLAFAGVNGSGKSTCLRLLLALAQPRAGAIRVAGRDLFDLDADAWRQRIAFLPQRPYLPPRSDVRGAIRFLAPEVSDGRMLNAIDRVGLTDSLRRCASDPLDAEVDALSIGQRQRVALARLLCRDASLFLLDEPDANLDGAGVLLVAEIVRELAKESAVAFAAHSRELLALAELVVELEGPRAVVRPEIPMSERTAPPRKASPA